MGRGVAKINAPSIVARKLDRLSPWVVLVTKTVVFPGEAMPQEFHSLVQSDYVTVLCITPDGRIPLVRQYRPAVERMTLELPGGLLDTSEQPHQAALREVYEETGYRATCPPISLGCLVPDTGRLENKIWCYKMQITGEVESDWHPESGVDRGLVSKRELQTMISDGHFENALHVAVLGLACLKGHFDWN